MNKLPSGWQIKSVGEVAAVIRGITFTPGDKVDKENKDAIPCLRTSNVQFKVEWDDLIYIPRRFVKDKERFLRKGDTLISTANSKDLVGKCSFVDDLKYESTLGGFISAIRPTQGVIEPSFLFHYLTQASIRSYLKKVSRQTTNIANLSIPDLVSLKIPTPPLPIQKQIVEILEKADQAKQKRWEANNLTEQFLQSAFIEMFDDQQRMSKGIKIKKLAEITTQITDGVHAKPIYIEKGIPFISVKDITTGKLLFNKVKYISEEQHKTFIKRCKPEFLDILYTKVGATYGRPALVDTEREFSIYVSVALIKPNRSIIDPYYLRFALQSQSVRLQADKRVKGIGVPDLHLVEIKNFDIIVPPLILQQKFAELVQKTEALKEKQIKSEIELENLFNSLMQKAFKGELV